MKTPNWKEHTEKLLNWYEVLIKQGNPKGDDAKEGIAAFLEKRDPKWD